MTAHRAVQLVSS